MKIHYQCLLLLFLIQASATYGSPQLQPEFNLEKLGRKFQEGTDALTWEFQFILNQGGQGIGLQSEGERSENLTQGHETKLFFSRHAEGRRFWQIGWSSDIKAEHERHWLFALTSFALPTAIELETTLFISDEEYSALELKFMRNTPLTGRWFLQPEVQVMANGYNDDDTGTGAGLSVIEAELRLSYQRQTSLSSFVGVSWEKSYGRTADYLVSAGEKPEHSSIVAGIAFRF